MLSISRSELLTIKSSVEQLLSENVAGTFSCVIRMQSAIKCINALLQNETIDLLSSAYDDVVSMTLELRKREISWHLSCNQIA